MFFFFVWVYNFLSFLLLSSSFRSFFLSSPTPFGRPVAVSSVLLLPAVTFLLSSVLTWFCVYVSMYAHLPFCFLYCSTVFALSFVICFVCSRLSICCFLILAPFIIVYLQLSLWKWQRAHTPPRFFDHFTLIWLCFVALLLIVWLFVYGYRGNGCCRKIVERCGTCVSSVVMLLVHQDWRSSVGMCFRN